jgi:hypothetical protein
LIKKSITQDLSKIPTYNQEKSFLQSCETTQLIQSADFFLEKSNDYIFLDEKFISNRREVRKFNEL